jgi:hypothetical protein
MKAPTKLLKRTAPKAPKPPAIPITLATFPIGKASATTTFIVNNQLKQAIATILKMINVPAALGIKGVSAQSGTKHVIKLSILFLAINGEYPLRTNRSENAELPMAPKSASKNGIHPNIPIWAKVSPDSSCRYPGSQNKQKYQTGSVRKRMANTPHKLFVFHN